MQITLAYDHHTEIIHVVNASALDFAINLRRRPVAFQGRVKDPIMMRQGMLALHEAIISDSRFSAQNFLFDPVITVHPDQVFWEAFSTDQSVYVRMSVATDAFEITGETTYGTTNIDFTPMLREAMLNLRSTRKTTFTISAARLAAQTGQQTYFEHKVDLPDSWVRGFLQVQSALATKPYIFTMRPVDLLSVINHFMDNISRRPPHGMRFEFKPGQAISIVLEPWNQRFWLEGTSYSGYERMVRVWGRRRLSLLLNILPFADQVTVGVLGRGLPHFYICECGAYQFTLVLSGWVQNDWSASSALDLLAPQTPINEEMVASVYNFLVRRLVVSSEDVEAHTLLDAAQVEAALFALCRDGRAMVDPATRQYRSRELFADPLNPETILARDPRLERARHLASEVTIHSVTPSETRKNETRILAAVQGQDVLVAVDAEMRVRFAQCSCPFFEDNMMSCGPCEHILAVRFAAEGRLAEPEKRDRLDL